MSLLSRFIVLILKRAYINAARDGLWQSYQLESSNDTSIDASPISDPMHLASLTFISPSQACRSRDEVSVLSLGSSHVLLVGVNKAKSPEIVLLLWDLQYSVLLASHSLSLPTTLPYSKDTSIKLDLVAANMSHALLVLSPTRVSASAKSETSSASSRSSVLVVPFIVPALSTIANAMGRAKDGLQWLANDSTSISGLDAGQNKLLDVMRIAMEQNRPTAASTAFFEWEKEEAARLQEAEQQAVGSVDSNKGPKVCTRFFFCV